MAEPEKVAAHRALTAERELVVSERDLADATLQGLRRLRADGFDDDEHDPDGAPLSSEVGRLEGLVRAASARLADLDAALVNLDAGRYGICVSCGRTIPPGRLAVRPAATTCVDCAR